MSERSLNGYINRKLSYIFIVLILIVLIVVFFVLDGLIGNMAYKYLDDLTIDMLISTLEYFDNTLRSYERSSDTVLTNIIADYSESDLNALIQHSNEEINEYFMEVIAEHSSELALIGIDSKSYSNIYYYFINRQGLITKSNNSKELNKEMKNYREISGVDRDRISFDRFTYDCEESLFRKDAYIPLNGNILKISIPLSGEIFNGTFSRFESMKNKFPFLQEVSIYRDEFNPISGVYPNPTEEDKLYFGRLSNTDSSLRKSVDRHSFNYYTYWGNKIENYLSQEPYYLKLRIDYSDNILLVSRAISLFICLIIFLAIFSVFLFNRHLARKITIPFISLAENMNKLGSNSDLSTIDEKLERTDIKEVNMLLASYQEMTGEIGSYFQELKAINEELEDSYRETSVLAENLHNVIHVATKLTDNIFNDKDSFLQELFYLAKKLIPEADYGTVFVVENDRIKWLETIGHSFDDINTVNFDLDYYKTLDDVVYIRDLSEAENDDGNYSNLLRDLLAVKRPIKSFITVQLFVGDELAGALNYDIAKSSSREFSKQSIETIKAFGSLASAFLTMQSYRHIHENFQREIILAIINILEIHDSYTKGHSENVSRISVLIAKEMGYSTAEIRNIEWAGLVHDIGKILISKKILNKKGVLTAEEYDQIKKHTIWGYEVLVSSEELKEIAIYVRHHHERWDGTGYPDELKGREIPKIARIIALADSWDTMRSDRVYRSKLPKELAIQELIDNRGEQFEPEVVDVALKLIEEGKLD